ncbi:MAG: hypothetical protein COA57_11185 [Flavobacteriales bacterium]|nr:MAG: hypothetical protein COA57_11185 [Flavobacteriales bacterium]
MIKLTFHLLLVTQLTINPKGYCSAVDSLKQVLATEIHDTTRVNTLLALQEQYYVSRPDTAILLCQEAERLSVAINYSRGISEAYGQLGYLLIQQGKIETALAYNHKSLKILEQSGDKKSIAAVLNNIGYIYENQGDIEKGLDYYHKSLKIKEKIGDKKGEAYSLNNIGFIYMNQDDIEKGLEYIHKSLKIYEEIGDKKGEAISLNNIGLIYKNQGDIEKGLDYYHKSLKIRKELGDKTGEANSLNNIGVIYYNQGDPSCVGSKEECLRAGIEKGLDYYHKSLKIYEEIGNKQGVANSLNNIGSIYLDEGNAGEAKNHAKRSLDLSQELGNPKLISQATGLLNRIAKREGNYKEALEMYELHIKMRDSIKNEETQKATIRQQIKYEFEKAQIIKEQEEKERQRQLAAAVSRRDNLQYSIIGVSFLFLVLAFLLLVRVNVPVRWMEGAIFLIFLIFFEFILVLTDPYVDSSTGGAPGWKLLINAGIAGLIFPLHAFFEKVLKRRLVK